MVGKLPVAAFLLFLLLFLEKGIAP